MARTLISLTAAAIACVIASGAESAGQDLLRGGPPDSAHLERASAYSFEFRGVAFIVMHDGRVVFEKYAEGWSSQRAHDTSNGTAALSGFMAAVAAQDGLLGLDEKVSETISEWSSDPRKSRVTVRQLLGLVSGIDAGGEKPRSPSCLAAVCAPQVAEPDAVFSLGHAPYQVFCELLKRKLSNRGETVPGWLERRILTPAGLGTVAWKRDAGGDPDLSAGVMISPSNWARFGETVRLEGRIDGIEVIEKRWLDECFKGSSANPAYGLGWWLNAEVPAAARKKIPQFVKGVPYLKSMLFVPDDMVAALGAGKQQLWVSRKAKLVVVRQAIGFTASLAGDKSGFSEEVFLKLIFTGEGEWAPPPVAMNEMSVRAKRLMIAFDKDGDGKLSLPEVPLRIRRHFSYFDKDLDGMLDGDEFEKALDWANTGGK